MGRIHQIILPGCSWSLPPWGLQRSFRGRERHFTNRSRLEFGGFTSFVQKWRDQIPKEMAYVHENIYVHYKCLIELKLAQLQAKDHLWCFMFLFISVLRKCCVIADWSQRSEIAGSWSIGCPKAEFVLEQHACWFRGKDMGELICKIKMIGTLMVAHKKNVDTHPNIRYTVS